MDRLDRHDLVTACGSVIELAADPAVAQAWTTDSACSGMTVGGLTHHLVHQIHHLVNLLGARPTDQAPIELMEHYERAAWVTAAAHEEANTSIRDADNAAALRGHAVVLEEASQALERLPGLLASARYPDTVVIPWQGWALSTDDFLTTRAMELVVHSDDLAASLDLPPPAFAEPLVACVVGLLSGIALRRHGQTAVIRALSRPQRALGSISAF